MYPVLKEHFEKPGYYVNEKVRGEVFRHFGYFMTESTGHLSEYLPCFRKNRKALELYCDEPSFGGETGAYYKYCAMQAVALDQLASAVLGLKKTREMVSEILEAESRYLPQFAGNKLRPVGTVSIPAQVKPKEVPRDPALAIANRFGVLARA